MSKNTRTAVLSLLILAGIIISGFAFNNFQNNQSSSNSSNSSSANNNTSSTVSSTAASLVPNNSQFGEESSEQNTSTTSEAAASINNEAMKVADLAKFDGLNGSKCYIGYKGKVYDINDSKLWADGKHTPSSQVKCGQDNTQYMAKAPHGEDVLSKFQVVSTLE